MREEVKQAILEYLVHDEDTFISETVRIVQSVCAGCTPDELLKITAEALTTLYDEGYIFLYGLKGLGSGEWWQDGGITKELLQRQDKWYDASEDPVLVAPTDKGADYISPRPKKLLFLYLNKHKLKHAFIATSLIFSVIAAGFLIIGYNKGNFQPLWEWLLVFAISGTAMPTFLVLIAWADWQTKHNARKKAFSTPPFDQLGRLSFVRLLSGQETKWYFTEELQAGYVNGYRVRCDLADKNTQVIKFYILTYESALSKEEHEQLQKSFEPNLVVFEPGGLSWIYNIKRGTIRTVDDIKVTLLVLTKMLEQNGFRPRHPR